MRYTVSIKKNRDFKSLYRSGKSSVNPYLVIYCRKNRRGESRLGISVGTKVGKAVCRNRVRRRIREAYRLSEEKIRPGYDLVVVARVRAAAAGFQDIETALLCLCGKLGLLRGEEK
jgi:ribonuclease P protein component